MNVIRNIWLCDDCAVIAGTGDASSLDFYYSPAEAGRRLVEIETGLDRLPGLADDNSGDPQRECCDCGHIDAAAAFAYVGETDDDDDAYHVCPSCDGHDTDERKSGHNEFSYAGCDCCQSTLAGSLTRFAQLLEN